MKLDLEVQPTSQVLNLRFRCVLAGRSDQEPCALQNCRNGALRKRAWNGQNHQVQGWKRTKIWQVVGDWQLGSTWKL